MKKKLKMLWLLLLLPCLFACGEGEPTDGNADFKMTATVTGIGEKLEVTVIEGEYGASGPYLIITGKETKYIDAAGNALSRSDIAVGDTVEIYYGGQVMMSYPPQVVAARIVKK